jgi:pilus assembly protein CpaE
MARQIAALVAHDEAVPETLIAAHIPDGAGIELVAMSDSLTLDADAVRRADVDLLIVACREHSEEALMLVQWWHEVHPGRPVVMLSHDTDHSFVQRAFAVGADDLIVLNPGPYVPEQTRREVEFAIRKAVARNVVGGERAPDAGTLIGVLGPKGGTGKTVTATNLASALARRGRRTVLVDLDLQFGDVALAMGIAPEVTIFDLAVSGGSLDSEKLDDFLLRHPSGLRVLAAPVRPDQATSVTREFILAVYELLRREYDFIVVDTPPAFSSEVVATIDSSTVVCMVGMLDALSLKNARLGLETLDLMNYAQDKVRIVLNRANTAVGISEADAVMILGRTPDVLVPSDRNVATSLNDGAPVVLSQRRSDVAKAFESLADLFTITPETALFPDRKPRRVRRRGRRRARAASAAEIELSQVQ